jgi:D-alanyl-D-alanine carboxypeptidase
MIKKVVCFLFIIKILILSFTLSVSAAQGEDACAFKDFELEEYLAIINAIGETEEYPHYFTENADRYKDFQERHPEMPFETVIALVNVNNDMEGYSHVDIVTEPDELHVLLNKNFLLPQDWEPEELTNIGHGFLLRPEAAEQLEKMRAAMRDDNLNLIIVSTYRSIARQRNLFNNAASSRGVARAERAIARPGHSEHNTGLAVDVLHRGTTGSLSSMRFERTSQYLWLVENAHEFGFILRYPQGYTNISGYIFEPWHWRYVGIPIATAMHNREIVSYEDFYGRYLVQGMRDRVNAYIIEQQRLAEEAEAAALAAAAEAAALEAAEAAARIAAVEAAEAELARVEAVIRAAVQAAAAEALASARAELAQLDAIIHDNSYITIRFTVLILILVLSATGAVLFVAEPRLRGFRQGDDSGVASTSVLRRHGRSSPALRRQANGSNPRGGDNPHSGEFVLCRISRTKIILEPRLRSVMFLHRYLQAKLAFIIFKTINRVNHTKTKS